MRLLFGREFPFEDTLLAWDLLFADRLDPEIVDFVCIAMLLRVRWQCMSNHSVELKADLSKYWMRTTPML